ncbi:class I SAM-dependent methyltransferase [Aporhodopirellula aestuarii]|uniref:Class I SAM-dependent methyltransferase n=1 Tax=Aporhodopirellula aestuarii TaxID=2950107 RepID=A0ABT0UBH1_9BACT|nr:class I SAM-dependent methyltransferase [Aporhodopirellula aestuarii]MCM2374352.1 class I SAM-dependent methyltransferase [Aporhodopirellula aestuarii]
MRPNSRLANHRCFVVAILATLLLTPPPTCLCADDGTARNAVASESAEGTPDSGPDTTTPSYPRPKEKARKTYMGRIVAQPMSHLGASWLVRPERNDEESAVEAFGQLGIRPGMTVVDLGCGNGFWTLPMAKACARKTLPGENQGDANDVDDWDGQVIAVDIQREMLAKLRQNMARARVDNIRPILGKVDDPRLPAGEVDLVLLVDVYHEFSHPESMLWEIRESLKPNGVIALLEYRAEDPDVPIKPLHKMSKHQIMKEYAASNLKLVREYNALPWQHLMFFARDDSPLPAIEPQPF